MTANSQQSTVIQKALNGVGYLYCRNSLCNRVDFATGSYPIAIINRFFKTLIFKGGHMSQMFGGLSPPKQR
jgi:hypothetical protein